MRRKDLPGILLDDYFEKVKTFTREAVRAEYNLSEFFLKLWFWWLSSDNGDKDVIIEKETVIAKKLNETKARFSIIGKKSGIMHFKDEEMDIFLQPEKINKFSLYIISDKKFNVSEEVSIRLEFGKETNELPGRIIRAEVLSLYNNYRYEIVTGFDTVKKAAAAKNILTYLKIRSKNFV